MSWFNKKEVIPEVLWSLRSKLPATLQVRVIPSQDGGYTARVENLPGCITEADSFIELSEMLNAAVYDYFEVPEQYVPHVRSYMPTPELVKEMEARGEKVRQMGARGEKEEELVFVTA